MKKVFFFFILMCLCFYSDLNATDNNADSEKYVDRDGITPLLIFSGYYGWWTGIVSHIIWDVGIEIKNNEKVLPLTPVITTTASVLSTYYLTKNKQISNSNSSIIALGGHLGTWQGLGWSAYTDAKRNANLNYGLWGGMSGITTGILSHKLIKFSDGGALLTHGSMFWGMWFGYVAAKFMKDKKDQLLFDMLIASDIFVISSAVLLRESSFSRRDVYGINALGALNGIIFWALYWAYTVEDDKYNGNTALAITATGSAAGLIVGALLAKKNGIYSFKLNEKINFVLNPDIQYIHDKRNNLVQIPSVNLNLIF